jgi:peptidoglycan/xylan/chitin deacetylase (PgdA/CDA1 family)
LQAIARKLTEHLKPNGLLLMAHAKVAADDPDSSGFNWGHPFGGRSIGRVFSQSHGLHLLKKLQTPLYEIHLLCRETVATPASAVEVIERPMAKRLEYHVSSQVEWHGCAALKRREVTDQLTILMYHRVSPKRGPAALEPFRMDPERFTAQIDYLARQGYYGIDLHGWQQAINRDRELPGRAVMLTFDDGYLDFVEHVWPVLQQYGFPATVFLVADRVGGRAEWDAHHGSPARLMDWPQIRHLAAQGISFGSHTLDHPYLTTLDTREIIRQGQCSREVIEQNIGTEVIAIAYPYGDYEMVVSTALAACGYTFGLTCEEKGCRLQDPPMRLGRFEIGSQDTIQQFAAKLQPTRRRAAALIARQHLRRKLRQLARDLF